MKTHNSVLTPSKPTLVLAEDEIDLQEILVEDLTSLNWQVSAFSNGADALEYTINHADKIDLILSDINMPKMNGMKFLESIKSKKIHIPFVILTAYADKENAVSALQLGAYDFLNKPYKLEVLQKSLVKALMYHEAIKLADTELHESLEWLTDEGRSTKAFIEAKKEILKLKKLRNLGE